MKIITPEEKRLMGQFFTTTNPFVTDAFVLWMKGINERLDTPTIIEPFAGSNNIVWMVRELGFENDWASFDVSPSDHNTAEDIPVNILDTIKCFPRGFSIAITNPPYLAKNSATARGLNYCGGEFEDLYQKSLSVMLDNCDYVAAIIPDTFVKQSLFTSRLTCVVSLPCRMFEDTSHPVCLALFSPNGESQEDDFDIWSGNRLIDTFQNLKGHMLPVGTKFPWKFNDPHGPIALKGYDSTQKADIAFFPGSHYPPEAIKTSSRHNTRISLEGLDPAEIPQVIELANKKLTEQRLATKDIFMTAHRGLRRDGKYRRRLEFSQAREILNSSLLEVRGSKGKLQ